MNLTVAEYNAINSLTQQTDYRGLCDCLLASITNIAGGKSPTLLEVYDDRGPSGTQQLALDHMVIREYPSLDSQDQPGWLAAAMTASSAEKISIITQDTGELICVGEIAGVWRFVEIGGHRDIAVQNCIGRVAGIFANLMLLIDRFERDPLTTLLNRQSFDQRFKDLIEYHRQNPRRKRVNDLPWLAIADIDHFKQVNDTYGHLFGDEILLLVSQIMRRAFRFDDLLFRYGGEEFIIILNNTDHVGADLALERFRRAIQNTIFPRLDEMTMSIGWAGATTRDHYSAIIHKADKALYYAKGNGRNRVVNYATVFGDDDVGDDRAYENVLFDGGATGS